jgi:hypothetical protein
MENPAGAGKVNYLHFVLAFRSVPGEAGIAYLVGVRGKAKAPDVDRAFAAVVDRRVLPGNQGVGLMVSLTIGLTREHRSESRRLAHSAADH